MARPRHRGRSRRSPARPIAFANLVDWTGTGIWLTVSALYFSRFVGLGAAQIGVGMTLGGLVGLGAVVPVTALARRWSARWVSVGLHLFRALTMLGYLAVDSFAGFVVLMCLAAIGDRPAAALNQVLVARSLPPARRAPTMALLHVTTNIGITLGASLGGLALWGESSTAYTVVIAVDALSFVGAAAALASLPATDADLPVRDGSPPASAALAVLRDRRFVTVALGLGILALHVPLLNVVVPLWVSQRTELPIAIVAPLFVLNTLVVVALQIPVSRRVITVAGGRTAGTLAGIALAASAACIAATELVPIVASAALLVVGVVLLTVAEMCHGAAAWVLSFGLSPEGDRQPTYLGFFALGSASCIVLGPALLTTLTLGWGPVGWALLGAGLMTGVLVVRLQSARVRSPRRVGAPAGHPVASE